MSLPLLGIILLVTLLTVTAGSPQPRNYHERTISNRNCGVLFAGCEVLGVITVNSTENRVYQEEWGGIQNL
jgi:hypothetical protein